VTVILYMIARQFRHILQMKLMKAEGINVNEAALKIGITPYAAGKILRQSQSFSVDALKKALERCLETDVGIKSGKIDERTAAELLIVEVTGI
jgi:DNA polymerase-3 subunit delta